MGKKSAKNDKKCNRRVNSTYTIRLRGPVSQSVRAFHPRGLHQCGETAAQSTDGAKRLHAIQIQRYQYCSGFWLFVVAAYLL